jgi:ProP effector
MRAAPIDGNQSIPVAGRGIAVLCSFILFLTCPRKFFSMNSPDTLPTAEPVTPAAVTQPVIPLAPAPNPVQAARSLLKELQQTYPAFRDCLPLAIGIDKQIIERQPELPRKTLRIALGQHTNSLRYLKAVEKAVNRFDLDGTPGEALTDEHRKRAATLLKERFKKEADQRKAHRAAEAALQATADAERALAEAARLRSEKLNLLAAKFSK